MAWLARPLARDTLWSLAAIILVGLSALAYSSLIGRFLGDAALGEAGLSLALGLGGAQVVTAGLAPAITRFGAARLAAGDTGGARRALAGGLATSLLLGAGLAALLLGTNASLAAHLGLPPSLIASTAGLLFLQCLYISTKAALYGLGEVRAYAGAELPAGLAFAATLIGLLRGAPIPIISPFLVANAVFLARAAWLLGAAWPRDGHDPKLGSSLAETPAERDGMPRYALIASLGSAAALARLQLVVLVTAAFWASAEVGQLQAALTFLPPVLLAPRALELSLLPRLAGDWGGAKQAAFRRRVSTATQVSALGLSLSAGGLTLASGWLLPALFGPDFGAAVPALRWTLLAAWALGLAAPAVTALSGADGVRVPNLAGLAGLLVSLAAWAWWVPSRGATGAAAGLALGSLVNAGIPLAWAIRRYHLSWRPSAGLLVRATILLLASATLLGFQADLLPGMALWVALCYVIVLGAWEGRRLRASFSA